MQTDEIYSTFWSHAQELRKSFLKIFYTILAGIILSFFFYQPLIQLIINPATYSFSQQTNLEIHQLDQFKVFNPTNEKIIFQLPDFAQPLTHIESMIKTYEILPNQEFIYTLPRTNPLVLLSPLEGILSAIQISVWVGIILTSPIWLFFILEFVSPALYKEEKQLLWPFLSLSFLLIGIGFCFTFFVTIPVANQYFSLFNQSIGTNLWSLKHYLDYTLFLLLANGFAFELGVIGFFAVHLRFISADWLIEKRRIAIVCAFILGAILTPPDILTQVMLAFPLIVIYELIIIYGKFRTQETTNQ